ncbi:hypothetical protein [Alkanindiges illinoisensis]|uniref:Uncharacterized protein n=1 Tax=Alkanindiges illinoisensis TaxID=197183 RepID=A0A4Y7X8M3_9GAMM|nr:hypothetical protein [Alkanindiges illinoisensis]TEU23368.1 hypothetical protein E2B99_13715 [Alkanindiges illinoisensis]
MTITDQQSEFIQSHDGDLTPEQAAALLDMADGDTATAETGSTPDATPEPDVTPQPKPAEQVAEPDPDNSVILAKDGKHTIPFEKLTEARNAEKHWKQQYEAMQQQMADLQAQAQLRADAGIAPTVTDNQVAAAEAAIANGVDPQIFGDFSEEALAKGIQQLIDQQVKAQVEAHLSSALKPIQDKQALDAVQAHYQAIYEKHPDADSIAESSELDNWIKSQPSFVQAATVDVLQNGSAQQIVELFDRFKQDTGKTQVADSDIKAKAQAAIANTAPQPPASLSDFPAGRPGAAATQQEAMAAMDSQSLLDHMQGMSPEQIEQFLNRRI